MKADWPRLLKTIRAADPYAAADDLGVPLEPIEAGVERPQAQRRLYRIADDAFVLAMPAGRAEDGRIPFSFYWAASEGAALRAALGRLDADDDTTGDPPSEILLAPGLLTRSNLQTWVRANQPRYTEEGFAGFSPLRGAYVRLSQLVYHFRSIRWQPDERPYAIEYDPRPAEPLFRKLAAFHLGRQ